MEVSVSHVEQTVMQVFAIRGERRLPVDKPASDSEAKVDEWDEQDGERNRERDESRVELLWVNS